MKRVKGEKCNLSDLKVGQLCKVLEVNIEEIELKKHILEMGLTRNTIVRVKKISPFGEPVVLQLRGYELFLGKHELKKIYVEVV